MYRIGLHLLLLAGLFLNTSAESLAAERAALLVGNQSYTSAPLQTPLNDVRALRLSLISAGFVVEVIEDTRQAAFYEQVDRFFTLHSAAKVHLFFYSGHGIALNGRNYLIPVEAKLDAPDALSQLFDLRHLVESLEKTRASTRIVILDACRTNPFSRNPSASSGLSELIAPANTLVAFSTAPGTVADDGDTQNSPYTEALLSSLFAPGRKIEDAFKLVRRQVRQATKGSQIPWESTSLENDFVMVPAQTAEPATPAKVKPNDAKTAAAQLPVGSGTEAIARKNRCSTILTKLSLGFRPLSEAERTELARCQ
jgi:uncharacterized caspase-like protein